MASYEKWYLSDRGEPVKLFHSLRDGGKYLRVSVGVEGGGVSVMGEGEGVSM